MPVGAVADVLRSSGGLLAYSDGVGTVARDARQVVHAAIEFNTKSDASAGPGIDEVIKHSKYVTDRGEIGIEVGNDDNVAGDGQTGKPEQSVLGYRAVGKRRGALRHRLGMRY